MPRWLVVVSLSLDVVWTIDCDKIPVRQLVPTKALTLCKNAVPEAFQTPKDHAAFQFTSPSLFARFSLIEAVSLSKNIQLVWQ